MSPHNRHGHGILAQRGSCVKGNGEVAQFSLMVLIRLGIMLVFFPYNAHPLCCSYGSICIICGPCGINVSAIGTIGMATSIVGEEGVATDTVATFK